MGTRRGGSGPGHPDSNRIAQPQIDLARTPFEHTAAFRRFGPTLDPDMLGPEDLYTKALLQEQGFDGPPHVVSATVLDAFVQGGEPELFRGVAHPSHARQLRRGTLFVGRGLRLGGGTYLAGGPDGLDHARAYAQDPPAVILRATLKQGARLVAARTLLQEMERARRRGPSGHATGKTQAVVRAMTTIPSVYAAYLGYDGIMDEASGVWLLLNRTALRIQAEDLQP